MYDNSYLSHKTRCNGFISRLYTPIVKSKQKKVVKKVVEEKESEPVPYIKEKAPRKEYAFIKVTNPIPVDKDTPPRRKAVIKTWGGTYSIQSLADELNVRLKTMSDTVKGLKEVTIDGKKYTIENKTIKLDLYYKGVLLHEKKTIKEAAPIIETSASYVSQIKESGKTAVNGWSVKEC